MALTRQQSARSRKPVRAKDLCVGCIVWLPPRNVIPDQVISCSNNNCCDQRVLSDKGYDHPVVVLKIEQRRASNITGDVICTVALVTFSLFRVWGRVAYQYLDDNISTRNTKLDQYIESHKRVRKYQKSLPICHSQQDDPSVAIDGCVPVLYLGIGELHKQSYVKIDHIYHIQISSLRTYGKPYNRAYKLRLSLGSYKILMAAVDIPEADYECQDTLWETARPRLIELASDETKHWQVRHLDADELSSEEMARIIEPSDAVENSTYCPASRSRLGFPTNGHSSHTNATLEYGSFAIFPASRIGTLPQYRSDDVPSPEGQVHNKGNSIPLLIAISTLVVGGMVVRFCLGK